MYGLVSLALDREDDSSYLWSMAEDKQATPPAGRSLATLGQRSAANFLDGACGCIFVVLGLWLGAGLFLGLADIAVGNPSLGWLAVGLLVGLPLVGVGLPLILYFLGFSVGRPIVGISMVYEDGSRVPTLRSRRVTKRIYLVSRAPRSS
jgi:uncharacterized RDD family membrane protein YckC